MDQYEDNLNAITQELDISATQSHEEITKGFLAKIDSLCQTPATEDIDEKDEEIKTLCLKYLTYSESYSEIAAAKNNASKKDHPDAAKVKSETLSIIRGLQKTIILQAQCSLQINTNIFILEEEIKEEIEQNGEGDPNIKWSRELPKQIATFCKRRDYLSETLVLMRRVKMMVGILDPVFNYLEKELSELFDEKTAKNLIADYTGQLRKLNFTTAEKTIKDAAEKDMKAFFKLKKKKRKERWNFLFEIIDVTSKLVERIHTRLKGREQKIFLRSWELNLAYEDTDKLLLQTRGFIEKHTVPEIKCRLTKLIEKQKALNEIAIFEDLIAIYEDIHIQCHSPMATLKEVNTFESEMHKKIEDIVYTQSPMIEELENQAKELLIGPKSESISDDDLFKDET